MKLEPILFAQRRVLKKKKEKGLKNSSKLWALAAKWMKMLFIEMGKTIGRANFGGIGVQFWIC